MIRGQGVLTRTGGVPGRAPRHAFMEEEGEACTLIAGAVALATGGPAAAQSLPPTHQGPAAVAPSGSLVVAQLTYPPTLPPPPSPPMEPPTPRAENPPPPPPLAPGATAYVWKPGRWAWTGSQYVWVEGRYVESPQVTARWVPGHWQRRNNGSWAWVDGGWSYATEGMGR
jgi:hypothetical protein